MQQMPRPSSDNTFQVAFKIPEKWVKLADKIASGMARPGIAPTRTDILRAALWDGLIGLQQQLVQQEINALPLDRESEAKPRKR